MSAKGANADMHYLFHQHKPLLSWMHWMKSMSESIWEGSVAAGKCTAGVSHSKINQRKPTLPNEPSEFVECEIC